VQDGDAHAAVAEDCSGNVNSQFADEQRNLGSCGRGLASLVLNSKKKEGHELKMASCAQTGRESGETHAADSPLGCHISEVNLQVGGDCG